MGEEARPCPKCPPAGSPKWVTTFADLMSLLLCFFVLLLSFSVIEVKKFKQMAGSMRMAFGVQREVEVSDVPMGTSIVAQEFSPGKPEPTPVLDVRQLSSEEMPRLQGVDTEQEADRQAEELRNALGDAVETGKIDVDSRAGEVIIRIRERGSFPSGSADLDADFIPVLNHIRDHLVKTEGKIEVAGHTDNLPIATFRYRSNWELSSARAVSVLHQLLSAPELDPHRFEVKGLADTQPVVPNDTVENRAKNRRVEIVLRIQEDAPVTADVYEGEG